MTFRRLPAMTLTCVVAALFASPAASQPRETPPGTRWIADGVVWRDTSPPTLAQLAQAAAPVLWFSPDEFLVKDGKPIPASLEQTSGRAVYYRAVEIDTRGKLQTWQQCLSAPACVVTADAGALVIRYMFYYPSDRGFGGHPHDLEMMDVQFRIETTGGQTMARIVNVAVAAHGVGWYTNELSVDRSGGLLLPIHLLVEEGKHAAAPDRDGDGVYEPGYDVNEFTEDAWGVRDRAILNFVPGSGYKPSMTKPRAARDRVWPDVIGTPSPPSPTYSLVHSPSSSLCEIQGSLRVLADERLNTFDHPDILKGFLTDKGFCSDVQKPSITKDWPAGLGGTIFRPYGMVMERLSIAYRYDGGRSGFALNIPYFHIAPLRGWIGVRANLLFEDKPITSDKFVGTVWEGNLRSTGITQFDLFYTRSAGRLSEWYGSVGGDLRSALDTRTNTYVANDHVLALEFGARLRFPLPDLLKRSLRVPFVGGRVGYRVVPARFRQESRLVFEIGLGAW